MPAAGWQLGPSCSWRPKRALPVSVALAQRSWWRAGADEETQRVAVFLLLPLPASGKAVEHRDSQKVGYDEGGYLPT